MWLNVGIRLSAFPDLHLELATTNYLGEPLPSTLLQPAVDAAIDKATYPCESPRFTADTLHVFYGVDVLEFIYRSASLHLLSVPTSQAVTRGDRRCAVAAVNVWNRLPDPLRQGRCRRISFNKIFRVAFL